jgi:hypothetical protein
MVYEEAVRVFYSEAFFVANDDMCDMTVFLKRIGPKRRKLIRSLAFPFSSPAIKQGLGGSSALGSLVDQLIDSTHLETIEIRAVGSAVESDLIRSMIRGLVQTRKVKDGAEVDIREYDPIVFSGIQHLLRLSFLRQLVIVCRMGWAGCGLVGGSRGQGVGWFEEEDEGYLVRFFGAT